MFGTPIAAALLLSRDGVGGPAPAVGPDLRAAGGGRGGCRDDLLFAGEAFVLTVDPYPGPQLIDFLTGSVIAVGGGRARAGRGATPFPRLFALFGRLGSPLLHRDRRRRGARLLGAIGGPITLFKGLEQMHELSADVDAYTVGGLVLVTVVKLLALLVAGTTGFRGGRIFPAVFVAVAFGLAINAAFPQVPEAVALGGQPASACSLAVTRSGCLALFMAALMVGHPEMMPLLCLIILPAWLVVTGRPEMIAPPRQRPGDRGGGRR